MKNHVLDAERLRNIAKKLLMAIKRGFLRLLAKDKRIFTVNKYQYSLPINQHFSYKPNKPLFSNCRVSSL
jgi:hypothetical protein